MKVLISCPISNREWILDEYLKGIYELDAPKNQITLYWIINNSKDQSYKMLKDFNKKYYKKYANILIDTYNNPQYPEDTNTRNTMVRKGYVYHWLAYLRNMILMKAASFDWLFSSDCDILLRSDTLQRLLLHKKQCVASLIYNGYLYRPKDAGPNYNPLQEAYKYPNFLLTINGEYRHVYSDVIRYPENNAPQTITECDVTGACILIHQSLTGKERYKWHSKGEDVPFCESVKSEGVPIYVDVSLFNQHIMNPSHFEQYREQEYMRRCLNGTNVRS